jgi:hypothetical protein
MGFAQTDNAGVIVVLTVLESAAKIADILLRATQTSVNPAVFCAPALTNVALSLAVVCRFPF